MRIFFIGTVKFSYDSLRRLLEAGEEIVGVATKSQSEFNADYEDLRPLCVEYYIPYKTVNDINHPNNIEFIRKFSPDVIYCFGWSNLLRSEILTLAPKGVIGFHPAEIPYNRGRHPIIWALCLGLKTTASTFFFMDNAADTGDIISQERVEILDTDDAASLYKKITEIGLNQILEFSKSLRNGTNLRIEQPSGCGNTWRKRGKKDGEIDFRMSSKAIYNLVRALTKPYVGSHVSYNGDELKVWSVEMVDFKFINLEPGRVLDADEFTFTVKTGDGAIKILKHEFKEIPKIDTYI